MGYRLIGTQLQLNTTFEMSSSAVTMGTIQVPPDGNPIVLMADRQTTGGYARFGQISRVDLPKFAQIRSGAQIRFYVVSIDEAVKKLIKIEQEMEKLQSVVKSIVL
jgi:antagonist of KipI